MSKKEIITEKQEKAARYAKAMGHPIRMYVLDLLSKQSCCYSGDLSEELPIVKSTLSQHLKELKDAGLIQGEIEAPGLSIASIKKIGKRHNYFLENYWELKKFDPIVRHFTNNKRLKYKIIWK